MKWKSFRLPAWILDCMLRIIQIHTLFLSYFGTGLYFTCRLCLFIRQMFVHELKRLTFHGYLVFEWVCFSLPFSQSFCYWAVVWKYCRDCRPYKISSPMTTVPIVRSFVRWLDMCVCHAIVGRVEKPFWLFFTHLKPFNAFAWASFHSFSYTLWTVISPTRIDKKQATKHFAVVIKCFKVHIFMPMFKN